jgi:hypothetical protein
VPAAALEVPKLAAASAAPALADAPDSVRFGRVAPRVGDHTHTLVLAKSTYVDPRSGPPALVEQYDSEFDEDVLAVNGPAATRVKVTFQRNETFDNVNTQPTVIAGKSYWVDVAPPLVADAQTQVAPSAEEVTRVLDIIPDLGTRTTIDQVLPDHPLKLGENRDALAGAILRILHPRFWTLAKGTAVLKSVTRDRKEDMATFDLAVTATSSNSGMTIDLKGMVKIRLRDSKLAQFVLEGTFTRPSGETGTLETSRLVPTVISP